MPEATKQSKIVFQLIMNPEEIPVITEEPLPGWLRCETEGQKPWFKTPVPRTVIRDATKLHDYLEKEHANGRLLSVNGEEFSFKRRFLKKNRPVSADSEVPEIVDPGASATKGSDDPNEVTKNDKESTTIVERLTRNTEVVDHRKLLSRSSQEMDDFRMNDGYQTPSNFELIKERIGSSSDLRGLLTILHSETPLMDSLNLMFSDTCLTEISCINTKAGPMVDFPPSINQNVYCKTVEFGMKECPTLIDFVINIVVRRGAPVLPSDALKIATLFSSICYAANQDLDALVKLRSLTLQVDGLTNVGLDICSDMGLAQCARSLSNHRDMFADIGEQVMNSTASMFPYQSILDNLDFQSEHLTLEVIEKETIDTSSLCTTKMSKDEALSSFRIEQVLLGHDQNKEECEHLLYVIALAAGRVIVDGRPEASMLDKYIPAHHKHSNSDKKLTPALTFIMKPYAYQETKNPDTIKLLVKLQRQYLSAVAKSRKDDPSFLKQLNLLKDLDASEDEREAAEEVVKQACLEFGEWLGSGDLLTVKMVLEAMMLMAGSATAFGRLEFLGPFRLQLLHMKVYRIYLLNHQVHANLLKMKKVSHDYSLCMPNEINYDDPLSLAWLTALTRMKISNKEKNIKKNDSSFEKHDQWITAVQSSFLVNMFDNFVEKFPERLEQVSSTEDTVKFVLDMLEEFNIQLYLDPIEKDLGDKTGEDDLFVYCQVSDLCVLQGWLSVIYL